MEINSTLLSLLASASVDPVLSALVLLAMGIIFLGLLLKRLNLPYIIAYILAGVVMGPFGLAVVKDEVLISSLGSFGLGLLLFFIGMEISLPKLVSNWKISVIGTLIQVVLSVALVWLIGYFMDWNMARIIMLGFVISLSSTAVVIKLLDDRGETNSVVGQNAIGILLAQDILIVPMLIITNYLSGHVPETQDVVLQIVGGVLLFFVMFWVMRKKRIRFPFDAYIKKDHELQVFIAFAICFGFAIITAYMGLSSALGAFVAGILVSSARATEWVHKSLHAFRVVFVALFFVSVGMLIDLKFLQVNVETVVLFVALVVVANTLINAIIMKLFGLSWSKSMYTGAILSQIGEFSFILGATGYASGVITEFTYQLIISIISITLIISPFWIILARKIFIKPLKVPS
ncbi:MAG: CPA2 family monovalent cation:H+ antiporter-2 [Candidatus Azotimanducaceae bacterium]|jgi:CPA2 family monovalent cation:H+ antiporter-2